MIAAVRNRYLVVLLLIAGVAIAVWFYVEHVNDLEAQKKYLWKRISHDRYSSLFECLEDSAGLNRIEWCTETDKAVERAVDR